MDNLKISDVINAYRKLKSMAYHDNSDLFLKSKIAQFESDRNLDRFEDPEDKLTILYDNLVDGKNSSSTNYWERKFENLDYYALPKEVKTFSEHETGKSGKEEKDILIKNIFTNQRILEEENEYEIKKLTLFIDAPVEVYILSILWIMKLGYHLDVKLDNKCFGNRLLTREDDKKNTYLVKDEGLFKPYYKQYQKWRDEGISTAKHYLDKGENVIFFNLDIKDYYYSVRMRKRRINDDLPEKDLAEWGFLNDLFWRLHISFTALVKYTGYPNSLLADIKDNESILPIGLPSSYVLANWYLSNFDKKVNEFVSPVYYSRYVDDIFIVTANNDINFELDRFEEKENRLNLTKSEKYIVNRLSRVLELVERPFAISKPDIAIQTDKLYAADYVFQVKDNKNLIIQASKTLVYFFDAKSSLALLDKFKDELERRSSEFRFLPDDELNNSGFDDEAYELVFEDSQHKIKTLKDYKENRYGISAHLSKKIFYTLRNGSRGTDEDAIKIIKFFRGTTNLEHYRQWERLLTYLLINDKVDYLFEYIKTTLYQLDKVKNSDQLSESNITSKKTKRDLTQQFILSIQMVFALNPKLKVPKEVNSLILQYQTIIQSTIRDLIADNEYLGLYRAFRWSNMIRHNYVNLPLLNYIDGGDDFSLLISNLEELGEIGDSFNNEKIKYSPRKVRFCEVAWMQCILQILNRRYSSKTVEGSDNLFNNGDSYEGTYLDRAFEIYYNINYWHQKNANFKNDLKKKIFEYLPLKSYYENDQLKIEVHEISVNPKGTKKFYGTKLDKVKVGLANMKVEERNYEAAMLGEPNLGERYQDFAKILNMAEREKCDIVVLPELALPPSQVKTFLDYSRNHQRLIVTGLEHFTHHEIAYNFVLNILPCEIRGIKDAVPILRLKNHYSPQEKFWIEDYRRTIPKQDPYRYHLYRWRGLYFSIYYCFELSDLHHRSLFKSKVDFIIASEWNPDVNYFSNIAEVSARDLHCYFIQVNTNQYGDSRIIQPSKTEIRDVLRIKGGGNTALLVDELEIKRLRAFQYMGFGLQKEDKSFKPTPADYDYQDVKSRQEGKSFGKLTNGGKE